MSSGFLFTFVLFLQFGLGFSPVISGLSFTVINAGFITASLLGPRLIPRIGSRVLSLGFALVAIGLVLILTTLSSYGTNVNLYELTLPLLVFGLGFGFVLSPLLGVILYGVPSQDAGAASGVVSTSFQIGNTVGISLFGLIFYRFLNNQSSSAAYLDAFKMILPYFTVMALAAFLIVFLLSQRRSTTVIHRLKTRPI